MALMPFSQSIMGRIVFKEEFQLSVWIGGVLAIIGIAVFFTGEELKGTESLWGNMLLLTVFCLMIVSQLLTRKIMKSDIPAIQVTASQMISATIIIFAYLLLFGNLDLPVQITSETKIALIYLVFSMSIPFFLYNLAMRQIPVGMASLFLVLIIPFGFFHASVFLGEEITWAKSFGAVLVMIGVALPHLLQTGRKRLVVKLQSK
jgi:drug/metabolite transporter (DMT)-like permease